MKIVFHAGQMLKMMSCKYTEMMLVRGQLNP